MRRRFQAWYRKYLLIPSGSTIFLRQGDGYENPYVDLAWAAWSASEASR